jgi:hypothetical protein
MHVDSWLTAPFAHLLLRELSPASAYEASVAALMGHLPPVAHHLPAHVTVKDMSLADSYGGPEHAAFLAELERLLFSNGAELCTALIAAWLVSSHRLPLASAAQQLSAYAPLRVPAFSLSLFLSLCVDKVVIRL